MKAPDGRLIYTNQRQTEGKNSFVPSITGQYSFCFSNTMSTLTPKTVLFVLKKGKEDAPDSLAKKGKELVDCVMD